jgi:hypothetical protein
MEGHREFIENFCQVIITEREREREREMIILVNKESARHQYGNYKIHDDLRQLE